MHGAVVWRDSRSMWATSVTFCGAFIVSRTGDVGARVAVAIAAVFPLMRLVAVGIAFLIAGVVAFLNAVCEDIIHVATVAAGVARVVARPFVAAGKRAAALLGRREP